MAAKKKKSTPYWTRVIAAAKKKAKKYGPKHLDRFFTPTQMVRAEVWTTCACGKQNDRIPRDTDGSPLDTQLFILGCRFNSAVFADRPKEAEKILGKIEKRAAKVLNALR